MQVKIPANLIFFINDRNFLEKWSVFQQREKHQLCAKEEKKRSRKLQKNLWSVQKNVFLEKIKIAWQNNKEPLKKLELRIFTISLTIYSQHFIEIYNKKVRKT